MMEEKNERAIVDRLLRAVESELSDLDEAQQAADFGVRGNAVAIVEAKARIKLEVEAAAMRIEANLVRMMSPQIAEKLSAIRQKLGGKGPDSAS